MNEFLTYVQMGIRHITDLSAFDHMLFVITLCAIYRLGEWKRILVLVTAFTIGHSLTLVLTGFQLLSVPGALVETLIPITILLTALFNVWERKPNGVIPIRHGLSLQYSLALVFGLIHGMGFANFFRALMGEEHKIAWPLFSFNVGIELGQLAIVAVFFGIQYTAGRFFQFRQREWNLFISGAGAGGALILIIQSNIG
ncbi:MAG: hypothetical protein RLY31_296 [Bacteroidota bacterium]|jgi:hypothetical protein